MQGAIINDLFYVINTDNLTITANEHNKTLIYDDGHVFFQGNLPHIMNGDFGTFMLTMKNHNFSIVPKQYEIFEMVFSDKSLEQSTYMGDYNGKINIQFF